MPLYVHYLERQNAKAQEVLLCIGTGSVLSDGRPIGFETDEFYYKSTAEMQRLFEKFPGSVETAGTIADRCSVELEFGKTYLPKYSPEEGKTPKDYLKELAIKGFDSKVSEGRIVFDSQHTETVYRDRIDYELTVIDQMGFGWNLGNSLDSYSGTTSITQRAGEFPSVREEDPAPGRSSHIL